MEVYLSVVDLLYLLASDRGCSLELRDRPVLKFDTNTFVLYIPRSTVE